jgi:hypothetical protein
MVPNSHLHLLSLPWLSFLSMAVIFFFTATVLIFCLLCRGRSLLFLHLVSQTPPWYRKTLDGVTNVVCLGGGA